MLEYVICFVLGIIVTKVFNYLTSLGYSILVLKQTQKSCAALFVASEQGLQEILHLKYIAMSEAKRSEQNITAQKYIDQMNIDSIKKSIMRNYKSVYPAAYQDSMEYSTWEEMEDYVNKMLKNNTFKEGTK